MIKALIIVLCVFTTAHADEWTRKDVMREGAWMTLHAIDWGQTLKVADQPDKYREYNPILGSHPSRSRVNAFMASTAVLHLGVSHVLSGEWRSFWQYLSIGFKATGVAHNFSIGLNVGF